MQALRDDLAASEARVDDLTYRLATANSFGDQCLDDIGRAMNRAEAAEQSLAAMQARVDGLEADAARYRFCVEHDVFPVIANDGKTWVVFVSVTSRRRSMFAAQTPSEAIDAAIAAQRQETGNDD